MSPLSPLIGGIFRFLRRLPRVTFDQIPELVTEMDRRLEPEREAFAFASWSVLKSEGVNVLGIPPVPEVGSELDSVLRGFQLAVVVRFVSSYLERSLSPFFEEALTDRLDNGELQAIAQFRDSCLDDGDLELRSRLAQEVHRIWGAPEPRVRVLGGLANGSAALRIMSQAHVAGVFGDVKMEKIITDRLGPFSS